MIEFDFVKPSTVADAVKALAGEGAQALSGGQTLTPTMKQRLATPSVLVSLNGIAEMRGVKTSGGTVTIGAATTHATVESFLLRPPAKKVSRRTDSATDEEVAGIDLNEPFRKWLATSEETGADLKVRL